MSGLEAMVTVTHSRFAMWLEQLKRKPKMVEPMMVI